jgi:chorismate mutase/prephenate dehydrogenase
MSEIEDLRKQIENIDEKIVYLLSERMKLSSKIGKIKQKNNFPITDEKREESVRLRWLSLSQKYGIPESIVDPLLNLIFSHSKIFQINPSHITKITVIGYGGMARSLISLFKISSQEVIVTGRDMKKAEKLASEFGYAYMEPYKAVEWGEIIIITLPPSGIISDFMKKLFPYFNNKKVMDILSTKHSVFGFLERMSVENNFNYISSHPLFGPYLYPVGEKIAVIPSITSPDLKEILEFWRNCGLFPIQTNLENHEKAMAIVQVLPHFYLMALSKSIDLLAKELDVDFSNFQTTNFRDIYKIIKRVNDLHNVIMEIQELNPYSQKARELGMKELNNLYNEFLGGKK